VEQPPARKSHLVATEAGYQRCQNNIHLKSASSVVYLQIEQPDIVSTSTNRLPKLIKLG